MSALVSVIIPCYNQGSYINDAINSVLNSDYNDFEIIVVNDGSTDSNTNRIIDSITNQKIKVIKTRNQGLSEARNTGIRASSGKYILPLDADDKISSSYISEAVNILDKNDSIKVISSEVRLFGTKRGRLKVMDFSLENLICQNTMVCSSFFRKKDFELTNGYNPNMKYGFEDWDFWLSLLENGGDVYRLPSEHVYYRIKRRSMITKLQKEENLKAMRKQIYLNHKKLYSSLFFDPVKSFEYNLIVDSKEYRTGKILLRPVRAIYAILKYLVTN